jgi:hypothetical protein
VRATDDRAVTVHPHSLLDPKPANHNDLKRGPEIFCFRFFAGFIYNKFNVKVTIWRGRFDQT